MPVTAQQHGMIFSRMPSWFTVRALLFLSAAEQRWGSGGETVQDERLEENRRWRGDKRDDHPRPERGTDKARWAKWNKWGTKMEILKMIYNQGCFHCWWSFMTLTHLGNSVATYARTSAGCHWIIYSYYQASLLCNTKKITLQKELTSCFSAYPWPCSSQRVAKL